MNIYKSLSEYFISLLNKQDLAIKKSRGDIEIMGFIDQVGKIKNSKYSLQGDSCGFTVARESNPSLCSWWRGYSCIDERGFLSKSYGVIKKLSGEEGLKYIEENDTVTVVITDFII